MVLEIGLHYDFSGRQARREVDWLINWGTFHLVKKQRKWRLHRESNENHG